MRSFLLRLESYFKRMPERDQKIFPYFMFVCIFIIFYYGLIMTTIHKTRMLKNENNNLEQKVFMLKSKVSVLDTVKIGMQKKEKDLKELEQKFYELKNRVPETDEVSKIVKSLAKAEKMNYLIRELDEKNYIKHKAYTEIPMSIYLEGDFYHALHFIKAIEDSDRFFLINGMSFDANEEINGNVNVTLNLSAFKIMQLEYYLNAFSEKKAEEKGEKNVKK
ncbi:hypothetical protein TTHT_1330 [Thermotomaculum hydrothermale]|uniref:Pilus assembly protein PilO n=1 Tax=Thermotomaculum hydrothermale TaxID=981385 RepID=A0A7R6PHR5_9BACT|nr:type 4a pilus biogenesis protein PilO [Thermotomaculum hydrothermale]BBB32844.1 hypothetical protein TTHT_1330 [Thermotomaculum hydrothermale]